MTWLLCAHVQTSVPYALYSLRSSHMAFLLFLAHAKLIPASGPLHMLLSLPSAFFLGPHMAVYSLVFRSLPTSLLFWLSFPSTLAKWLLLPCSEALKLIPLPVEHQHYKGRALLPLSTLISRNQDRAWPTVQCAQRTLQLMSHWGIPGAWVEGNWHTSGSEPQGFLNLQGWRKVPWSGL